MKKIPEEHWEYLLKTERPMAEKFILRLGYEIEDYNKFRKAYLKNKLEEYKREEEKEMAKSNANPQEIIELYKGGTKIHAISKQLKVGPPMIKKILGVNGLLETVEKEPKINNPVENKRVEKIEINNSELDYMATQLSQEELKGYIKGNVLRLLNTDMKKAEEYLHWYNRR